MIHPSGDGRLNIVINIYIHHDSFRKVPLFGWKSGTLLIEKRYFSSQKAVVFLLYKHKSLITNHIRLRVQGF